MRILGGVCLAVLFGTALAAAEPAERDPFAELAAEDEPTRASSPGPNALARDDHPLAGYQSGRFYLRDRSDNFRLIPTALLLLDTQMSLGPGTEDIPTDLSVRAARIGVQGSILEPISFALVLEADRQPLSNPQGQNQSAAAAPGSAPTAQSARYQGAQTAGNDSSILDAWINLSALDELNLMVGQFREPFTMENATPLSTLPFHERSLAVRAFGGPTLRDIGATLWGDIDAASVSYAVGLLQGDGRNRPGVDERADVVGRATWRPLGHLGGDLSRLRLGVSLRTGFRQSKFVNYDYPAMATQGGIALWRPTYTDSQDRRVHVIPADRQSAGGAELWLPYDIFSLRGEVLFVRNGTREAVEGFQAQSTERTGRMTGNAGYVILGATVWGEPGVTGEPGGGVRPAKLKFSKGDPLVPAQQVEALLRFEWLSAEYDGSARRGSSDLRALDGDISVLGFGAGVNYWATKHARVSLDYLLYVADDSGGPDNRARLPADDFGAGQDTLHELSLRLGVGF